MRVLNPRLFLFGSAYGQEEMKVSHRQRWFSFWWTAVVIRFALNVGRPVLTSAIQLPLALYTPSRLFLEVLGQNVSKWLGCMLTAGSSANHAVDLRYHLPQAVRAFHANRGNLQPQNISSNDRLHFFQCVVGSRANFGNPHRTIRRNLQTMAIVWRLSVGN